MTKSEQIKQMTDAELASEINNLMSEMCRIYCKGCPESKYRCNDWKVRLGNEKLS